MITVLLWGDRWWLPRQKMPVPFAEPGQAAAMLAAAWPERERRLRLVYQPDDFVTVPVTCPNAGRATLAMALAEEHPALIHPGVVWGYEPILPAGETYATLLHHETRPGVFALVQELEERGFAVDSVWPLPTWLNALPPDLTETGAITVVAAQADRFCFYRQSAGGGRSVESGRGYSSLENLAGRLRPAAGEPPADYILCVATDSELMGALEERLALAGVQAVGLFTLPEALARSATLPPHHPAQLLPPVPKLAAVRLATAATRMLLFAALAGAAAYGHVWRQAQTERADREISRRQLQAEVETLRANREAITALRAEIAALERKGPSASAFLRRVGAAVSADIVVTGIRISPEGFTLTGWSKPGADGDWAAQLGPGGKCTVRPDGAFTVQGPST